VRLSSKDATSNAEIRFRWLVLALVCHDPSRVDAAITMALEAFLCCAVSLPPFLCGDSWRIYEEAKKVRTRKDEHGVNMCSI
jgi:hypothetical protein